MTGKYGRGPDRITTNYPLTTGRGQAGSYRGPRIGTDWISFLIQIVAALKLNEIPDIAERVKRIAIKGDQRVAEKLVRRLTSDYYSQVLVPNHFLSVDDGLDGEILIGQLDDGKRVGLQREELVRHVGIFGQSGTGKTNLLKLIFMQARERGIPVLHFDRKGDLGHAVREGADSIHWSHLRINFLCPPTRAVDPYEWRNEFVKVFAESMQFWQRGLAVFLQGVDWLYKDFHVYEKWHEWDWTSMVFPSLQDLLDVFRWSNFGKTIKGQGKESLLSIIDKLQSLIIELEPIVSCQRGFDVVRLQQEKRALNYELDGLSVEYQNFIIVMELVRYAHLFKAHGPRNQLNVLFIFDEGKGIFGKANEKSFVVRDLVSKVRELGIGIICADQIPSEMSQYLFSNIGTLIMFRHSDGNDLQRLRYSSGANVQQILENYSLKVGQAVLRSSKSRDLHKFTVPFRPVEKFISRDEIDRLMAPRLAELHRDVISIVDESERKRRIPAKTEALCIDDQERVFLEELAQNFNRPSSEIYESVGLARSAGYRTKERLRKKGLISQLTTNLGQDGKKAVFLIPNPMVVDNFGIQLGPGRGGILHKHIQSELKSRLEKLGFGTTIEECTSGTSEGPDLGIEKNGLRIAVEVAVTSKPAQEIAHIEKNLRLGFNQVVLSFVNKRVLERSRELAQAQYPSNIFEQVSFCLINEVCSILSGG